jgi:hypothetical protein
MGKAGGSNRRAMEQNAGVKRVQLQEECSDLEDQGEEEVQADGNTALQKRQLHLLIARG